MNIRQHRIYAISTAVAFLLLTITGCGASGSKNKSNTVAEASDSATVYMTTEITPRLW